MKSERKPRHSVPRNTASSYALSIFLLILAGCSRGTAHDYEFPFLASRAASFDVLAEAYVRIALELGERDPDSLDFSTVPSTIREEVHRNYPSLDTIDQETSQLLSRLQTFPITHEQQSRAQFLVSQLQAIHARIAMLRGQNLDFATEAHVLFDTQRLPDNNAQHRIALRARIAAMLSSRRSPAADYAAYATHFLVPPGRLPAVMQAALASCRRQTLSYLTLPQDESVDLTFVRNQPWSAFSRFQGHAHSTIAINTDFPITVDQALELACHEGYPGHHVFNTLRDIALAQKKRWPEAQVQLTFSPQSYLSESAAAYAPRLAFTTAERTRIERDILFPLAGLPASEAERYTTICSFVRDLDTAQPRIAQQYLDGQLEFVRAVAQLQAELLMEHSEATLLYLNEYRSYMLAYTDGPRRIASLLEHAPVDSPTQNSQTPEYRREVWQRYAQLTGQMTLAPIQQEDGPIAMTM